MNELYIGGCDTLCQRRTVRASELSIAIDIPRYSGWCYWCCCLSVKRARRFGD